jgi:predicted regulator of Ras-like GTPase activity (Roadblock/LC7/MglB family)
MPVEGSLKELSLPNIIQLNCAEMNTARLSLRHGTREGIICFAEGAIVHAEVDDLVGEEAVYELLSWPDGSFVVETGVLAPERTISASWNELLLEGIRRIDEGEPEIAMSPTDDMTALTQELRNIAGVEGAVTISRDGIVLGGDMDGNAEKEGAIAVFVGNAAAQVGEGLDLSPFDWGLVTMGKDRMLILEQPDFFVGLLLGEKASPALVSAEARRLLE